MSELTRSDGGGRVPEPTGASRGAVGRKEDAGREEIELTEVVATLRRRIWVLVLMAALGGAGAWLWSQAQAPSYESSATIQIEDPRQQFSQGLGEPLLDRVRGPDPIRSQLEVLRSRGILGEIVDRQGLQVRSLTSGFSRTDLGDVEVADPNVADTLAVRFAEGGSEVTGFGARAQGRYGETLQVGPVRLTFPERPFHDDEPLGEALLLVQTRARAIERLDQDLVMTRREETDVVDLALSTRDPRLSRGIVDTALEVFRDRSTREATADAERRRVFLEEQLTQAEATLERAQDALSDFRRREGVLSSREWFAAHQEGILEIRMRREELGADRGMYRELLDGLRDGEPGDMTDRLESLVASPEFAENPVVEMTFEQLAQYETARDSLTSGPWGASAENPDVAWAEQQIERTRDRLEGTVRSHLNALDARLEALDELHGQTVAQIEGLPRAEAEEARLVQEVEMARATTERLREEYERAHMLAEVEDGPVRVVDRAALPLRPEGPGLPIYLVLGVMLGMMMGSGGALLMETMNTRIRHQGEVEELLRVPNLTVVPRMERDRRLEAGSGPGLGAELVTVQAEHTGSADAFRTLRTNLLFTESGADLSSVVVTSPSPEEGKTSTACNLAVTYAQQGFKTLLVDADLRKGRAHEVFGVSRVPGFSELVMGSAGWEEVAHDTPVDGLQLLPAGSYPPNPVELLGGMRVRKALEIFGDHFDVVVFDSAPVMAGPDSAVLGSLCDGTLLVVRSGSTGNEAGVETMRQLHTVGARVLGTVLNDPKGEVARYSDYHKYQYSYYGRGS